MNKKVVFLFGRFQPPTKGHAEMIQYAVNYANRIGAEARIYTSKSHDSSKNPLTYQQKVFFLRQIFPGVNIVDDPSIRTAFDICRKLSDAGVDDVTMITGGDRVDEFQNAIGKYVKPKGRGFDKTKHFAFKHFNVVNSGGRVKGISGTDLRKAVKKGDFETFAKVSAAPNRRLARTIFNATKRNLAEDVIQEQGLSRKDFHKMLQGFVDFSVNELQIKNPPTLKYKGASDHGEQPSFGGYSPHSKEIIVMSKNRHPMDIFRTVAHELVHHKQNEDGRLGHDVAEEGKTGSEIENDANAQAGVIMRKYGKHNPSCFGSSFVTEETINEGIHDSHIFKCIFLAGGAGSGKDYILNSVIKNNDTYSNGLKELNIDQAFKHLLQKAGLDLKMPDSEAHLREPQRNRARVAHLKNTQLKVDSRMGIIINGTADDYQKIQRLKSDYEKLGYDTMMVFVSTNNKVSRQRNHERGQKGDRALDPKVRFRTWRDAMNNKEKFASLFGRNFIEIDNSVDTRYATPDQKSKIERTHKDARSMVQRFINAPINDIAKRWIEDQKRVRGINERFENYLTEVGGAGNWGTPELTMRYQKDTPGQWSENRKTVIKVKGKKKLQLVDDRIGAEYGYPKSPTMGDNQTYDFGGFVPPEPISRWMVKEDTIKRFRAKYGSMAEQKIIQTAKRLAMSEGWEDAPYSGSIGALSGTSGTPEDVRPDNLDKNGKIDFNKYNKRTLKRK